MATSSSSRCVCLDDGFSAPSRLPDLASLPEPVRLVTAENPREFLDSACSGRRFFQACTHLMAAICYLLAACKQD